MKGFHGNTRKHNKTVKKLTLLNGFDAPQHGGRKHKQTARLVKLDLSHDAEGGAQADGHHGGVFEDVMLLAQHQRGDGQSENWRGGVDHLREGQLHVVQPHVPEGNAGTEGQTQHEDLTFSAGRQVLLADADVSDHPQLDQAVVHHDGCQHVQRRQQQGVPEVEHGEYPFVEAGDGAASHQPHNNR